MNVLVIPSWYPSRKNPLRGIFCREQAEALAACTDCNIIVCDWGQTDGAIPAAHPLEAARNFFWRMGARRQVRKRGERFHEFFEPSLIWSPRFPGGGNKRIFAAIRRTFDSACQQFGKIDLLHAHVCNPGGVLAGQLSAETKVPFVVTEHWSLFPGEVTDGRPEPEIEMTLRRASAVICVSSPAARKIETLGYRNVRVIHNLVDETRFTVQPFRSGIFRFFSMGGVVKHKGFDVLLRAIAQWSPRAGEVEFVIAGDGTSRPELQALASDLGIAGLVRWAGAVSRQEAPAYFQDCHAFVLASRRESFGVVFAEAIASGRPVIATRCGGPEDIVNQMNGILILPDSAGQLAAALEEMKRNHARYNPMAIREDFMRRFSRPAVTAQIRQLYCEVAGGN